MFRNKKIHVLLLLFFIAVTIHAREDNTGEPEEPAAPAGPPIVKLRNLLTFKTSLEYNFMAFEQTSQDYSFRTNRPWDVGIGLGIKNIFLGFSFSVPFLYDRNFDKSQSFDFSFDRYNKKSFTSGFVKYYDGFNDRIEHDIDLRILNIGASHEWITNNMHSLRSAYALDTRQTVSNGSFLIGLGAFFSSIHSESSKLSNYAKRQNTFYFGPNFGFSYTWVMSDNFFINVLSTFGFNHIINDGKFSIGFQALPRFSIGYNRKWWSLNLYSNYTYLLDKYSREYEYNLLSGTIGLAYTFRFL